MILRRLVDAMLHRGPSDERHRKADEIERLGVNSQVTLNRVQRVLDQGNASADRIRNEAMLAEQRFRR